MSDEPDSLAPFEADLEPADTLTCPVCRLVQPLEPPTCARCGADLSLLAQTLLEARQRQAACYRAILRGDTAAALSQIEALVALTGPTPELAVLRRLVRAGTVPVAVVDEPLWHDPLAAPAAPPAANESAPESPPPARGLPVWQIVVWLGLLAVALLAVGWGLGRRCP